MANTVQDEIYRRFLEASQGRGSEQRQSLADLILQADQVRSDYEQQAAGAASRGSSGSGRSTAQSASGGSALSTVFDVFKGGLSPLIKGLFGIFGGSGGESAPAPLTKYALPPSIHFQGAEAGGRMMNADYDQAGRARAYSGAADAARLAEPDGGASSGNAGSRAGSPAPQITVQVQAMDARSFMDRSNDIALAVRDAMLNLNAINDVVNEL
jgi:hypothetical protein